VYLLGLWWTPSTGSLQYQPAYLGIEVFRRRENNISLSVQ
jgi:hypothetical protein